MANKREQINQPALCADEKEQRDQYELEVHLQHPTPYNFIKGSRIEGFRTNLQLNEMIEENVFFYFKKTKAIRRDFINRNFNITLLVAI